MNLTIDHHIFDSLTNTWKKGRAQPQPTFKLSATLIMTDLSALTLGSAPIHGNTNTITVTALADTGCQSCLAGSNLLHKLGITSTDLIPVRTKMRSANNEGIKLLGAILLMLSGSDENGQIYSTNQMTYITDCTDTFFLSRGACVDLGIISDRFPTIGEAFAEALKTSAIRSAMSTTKITPSCHSSMWLPKANSPSTHSTTSCSLNRQQQVTIGEVLA